MPFTLESTWLLKFAYPIAIRLTIGSPSMNLRNRLYFICPLFLIPAHMAIDASGEGHPRSLQSAAAAESVWILNSLVVRV